MVFFKRKKHKISKKTTSSEKKAKKREKTLAFYIYVCFIMCSERNTLKKQLAKR